MYLGVTLVVNTYCEVIHALFLILRLIHVWLSWSVHGSLVTLSMTEYFRKSRFALFSYHLDWRHPFQRGGVSRIQSLWAQEHPRGQEEAYVVAEPHAHQGLSSVAPGHPFPLQCLGKRRPSPLETTSHHPKVAARNVYPSWVSVRSNPQHPTSHHSRLGDSRIIIRYAILRKHNNPTTRQDQDGQHVWHDISRHQQAGNTPESSWTRIRCVRHLPFADQKNGDKDARRTQKGTDDPVVGIR